MNIDNVERYFPYDDSHFDTLNDIVKYQNVYLIRDSFINIAKRGLEAFAYIRVKKSKVEAHDSVIGFIKNVKNVEYLEAEMTPLYYVENDKVFLQLIFEVDSTANKTKRTVFNL